jgi:hypothetical protein
MSRSSTPGDAKCPAALGEAGGRHALGMITSAMAHAVALLPSLVRVALTGALGAWHAEERWARRCRVSREAQPRFLVFPSRSVRRVPVQRLTEADSFEAIAGHGLQATLGGRRRAVGNQRLLERDGVSLDGLGERAAQLAAEGKTVMYMAVDGRPAGLVAAADKLRPSAAAAISGRAWTGLLLRDQCGRRLRRPTILGFRREITGVRGLKAD